MTLIQLEDRCRPSNRTSLELKLMQGGVCREVTQLLIEPVWN